MRFIAQKPIPVVHDRIRLGIVSPINGQQITVLFKIPPIIEREQLLGEEMPIGLYIGIIHGDFMPPYLAPGRSTQNNGSVNIATIVREKRHSPQCRLIEILLQIGDLFLGDRIILRSRGGIIQPRIERFGHVRDQRVLRGEWKILGPIGIFTSVRAGVEEKFADHAVEQQVITREFVLIGVIQEKRPVVGRKRLAQLGFGFRNAGGEF